MTATTALFRSELRLTGRNPAAVFFSVLMPVVALVVMCAIPAAREPLAPFGGLSVVEAYQPTLAVFASSMLALQMMPMTLGQYREMGYLRRLRTTPAHPGQLLAAVLGVTLLISLVVGIFLLAAPLVVGLGTVGRVALQVLLLVPVAASFLSIGALLSAVIPNPRAASGVGAAVAALMWFFAGMWFPRAQFPDWLAAVADLTPGGAAAAALTAAGEGQPVGLLPVLVLLVWTALGFAVAIRAFRWE